MIVDRITIDLDYYEPQMRLNAIRAVNHLERLDTVETVKTHVSTSGRGLHIEAHLSSLLDDDDRRTLRRHLNDDQQRVDLDAERTAVGHAGDIFWTEKAGNDEERREMPDIWTALDHLEHTRASDYSRVKALAQHGRKAVHDVHGLNRASLAEGE